MKKILGSVVVIWVLFIVIIGGSWIGNLVELLNCDGEAPYKCEIAHGAGLIPVVSLVTVWFDSDETDK